MTSPPIAVGGVGGSGSRIIARLLQEMGLFIGSDLPVSVDTVWYAALFGYRGVLLEDAEDLNAMFSLFFRQMKDPRPLTEAERFRLQEICRLPRHQHDPLTVDMWMNSFIEHCQSGGAAERWGWKVPYTFVLIDRLFDWSKDLKYVHIRRNGLDMAFSQNQNQLGKWGPVLLNRNVEIGPRDSLKFWGAVDRRMAQITKRFPARVLTVEFEDLVDHPDRVVAQIADFSEVQMSSDQVARFSETIIKPDSVGRHMFQDLSQFDPEDVDYVKSVYENAQGDSVL